MTLVKTRIAAPGINLREVAEGADVGYSWLKMFARGEIPDPGYSKIKALYDYFTGNGRAPINGSAKAATA